MFPRDPANMFRYRGFEIDQDNDLVHVIHMLYGVTMMSANRTKKIGTTMQNRISTLCSAVIAIIPVISLASSAMAGPLTNIFLESLENHGRASWVVGYQEGSVETLHDVVLRLDNGRRYDIATLTLHHEGNSLLVDATDIRMNPENDILLLKADRVLFKGHGGILETFWTLDMITDACALNGPDSSLRVENLGMILSGRKNGLSEDSKTRVKSLDLMTRINGNKDLCTVSVDLSVQGHESTHSDGSLTRASSVDISMRIPGSIAALAADPLQIIELDINTGSVRELIPGGATAWSVGESTITARFEALGLVPGLTLVLKHLNDETSVFLPDSRMRMWNIFGDLRGAASVAIDHMTMRLANMVPTDYVTRFIDANLTTMLFDLTGEFEIADEKVMLVTRAEVTGLADIDLLAEFRHDTYPDEVIARAGTAFIPFDGVVPIHLDHLHYEQTDRGLISAVEDIMELPVTIQINRLREERSAEYPEISDVIRGITTAIANFLNLSSRNPPAVLEMSVNDELDLREALIVATELPQEIPDIFEFSVFRNSEDEK